MAMTFVVPAPAPAESITLYLQLKPGQKADLEVVGRAAAAFAEAVKEISYILDPGLEVRLEFESGTEGSLKLKAILRTLHSPLARRAALLTVIGTVGGVLASDLRTYGVNKLLDYYFAPEQRLQLSDADVKRIADAVKGVNEGKIAKEPMREMYKQLDRDDAIESVGAIAKSNEKPVDPIPRSEFQTRAGIVPFVQTSSKARTTPSTERLTLISPVLLPADRVWRFRSPLGEYSYHVSDEKFLADLLSGRRRLTMKEGIQITAKIETNEVHEGGVWTPKQRFIVKVLRVHKQAKQSDLFAKPKKSKSGKKKKR